MLIGIFVLLINTVFSYLWGNDPHNQLYFIFWILSALSLSSYGYYLDIAKDWGVLGKDPKYIFLRNKLHYPKNCYYIAMALNFILRFAWILTINPALSNKMMRPELFTFMIGLLEIFRRSIWNFIRIENEMNDNSDKYIWEENLHLPFGSIRKEMIEVYEELWREQRFSEREFEDISDFYFVDFVDRNKISSFLIGNNELNEKTPLKDNFLSFRGTNETILKEEFREKELEKKTSERFKGKVFYFFSIP